MIGIFRLAVITWSFSRLIDMLIEVFLLIIILDLEHPLKIFTVEI